MKHRLPVLLLCVVMVISLMAGCGTKPGRTVNSNLAEEPTDKIINIPTTMDQMDQHWVTVDKGCKRRLKSLAILITNGWLLM